MPGQAIWFLLLGGALCSLGALVGVTFERRRLQFLMRDQAARNAELARRLTDTERALGEVQTHNKELSNFLLVLPDVVLRLNSRMAQRSIPPLLAGTLEQIFEPSQILVYLTKGKDELVLAYEKGLPEGRTSGRLLKFGEGRIGLAARHQTAVDRDDLHSDSLCRRVSPEAQDPPGFMAELIAPMVHEGRTLGVVCVGGVSHRHRDEKRMIKLVADLGALGLNNNHLFRQLEQTANVDSLTNLHTKRSLNMRLGDLTHKAEKAHTPLSVIMFDIDHFKRFNDTYGHLAGDVILKRVAALFKSQLRSDDIPARYGGEEFVVVLPGTTKEEGVMIAEKIRKAVEEHAFPAPGVAAGLSGVVTISGGVASHMIDGNDSNEILRAADQALYLAKEKGRNRIVAFRTRYLSDEDGEMEAAV